MLKISYKLLEKYHPKQRRKPIRKGYCKICGSKLSDEKSIERGIGKGCLAHNVAIILEIIPDAAPNPNYEPSASSDESSPATERARGAVRSS